MAKAVSILTERVDNILHTYFYKKTISTGWLPRFLTHDKSAIVFQLKRFFGMFCSNLNMLKQGLYRLP